MRILLLGEYSNVHWTLAEGLRALGHEVCVVSNGDYWKDYHRDVSLVRRSYGRWDSLVYMAQVWKALRRIIIGSTPAALHRRSDTRISISATVCAQTTLR